MSKFKLGDRIESSGGKGTFLIEITEKEGISAFILLDSNNGHSGFNKKISDDVDDIYHPFYNKLWFVGINNIQLIREKEQEKMIEVDGKEYSESTIKKALQEYVI